MKIVVPDYYTDFHCIAGACEHTCCAGWEVSIDAESMTRFRAVPEIAAEIEAGEPPCFHLTAEERCPFLKEDNLCRLIETYGEDILCQTCRDHPRFRNFWTGRTEMGLGLVCEEAARLILSRPAPMRLVTLSEDGDEPLLPEDEAWLMALRERLLSGITETGPRARLMEYLIFRHLPDALYDDRVEERIAFIGSSQREITEAWSRTDGSIEAIAECARAWSYAVEYDDEELEKRLSAENT